MFKESIQLNVEDDPDSHDSLTLGLRTQDLVGSSEVARAVLTNEQLRRITANENKTSHATVGATVGGAWNIKDFLTIDLVPRGKIWIR